MLLLLWILTKEPVRQIINLKDHQITHPNERQVGRSHADLDPQDFRLGVGTVKIDTADLAFREVGVKPALFLFIFAPLRTVHFAVVARLPLIPIIECGGSFLKGHERRN